MTVTNPESSVLAAMAAIEKLDLTAPGDYDLDEPRGLGSALDAARAIVAALESLEAARKELAEHVASCGRATYIVKDTIMSDEYEVDFPEEAARTFAEDLVIRPVTLDVQARPAYLPDAPWVTCTVELDEE